MHRRADYTRHILMGADTVALHPRFQPLFHHPPLSIEDAVNGRIGCNVMTAPF
jgi:hypothetical protein